MKSHGIVNYNSYEIDNLQSIKLTVGKGSGESPNSEMLGSILKKRRDPFSFNKPLMTVCHSLGRSLNRIVSI